MRVLVTGGLGYIGSHMVVELLQAGSDVAVVDNLENSNPRIIDPIERLGGREFTFFQSDIRCAVDLKAAFVGFQPDAVVHLAARKNPGESVEQAIEYYDTNVGGTITLLRVMAECEVKRLVFSSSAAVYGNQEVVPIPENAKLNALTPYAATKEVAERMIEFHSQATKDFSAVALRYFNPVASHQSGAFAEFHHHQSTSLFPAIFRSFALENGSFEVFGNDLPTRDGTGVRDYIHIQDLAIGHLAALRETSESPGFEVVNIGTGVGYSVKEVIETVECVCQRKITFRYGQRRPGDPEESYADPSRAFLKFGWKPVFGLEEMIRDEWQAFQPRS